MRRDARDQRGPFQIDRDRVLFSYAFRRLQSKTQVFQSGEYDFYRTRLTHTIEVARIARSIADALRDNSPYLDLDYFIDPDLVEGVGYAHDLGHPPFGHIGERKFNELMAEYGGFEGNAQTLRILTELIFEGRTESTGMRPTRAFIDGVLKYKALHSEMASELSRAPDNHFLYDEQASIRMFAFEGASSLPTRATDWNRLKSIECQIMDWADDTAYSQHDIVDGTRAGFLTAELVENWAVNHPEVIAGSQDMVTDLCRAIRDGALDRHLGARIGDFIHGCELEPVENSLTGISNRYRFRLRIDPEIKRDCLLKKRIALDLIFQSPQIQQSEFRGGIALQKLFDAFAENYVLVKGDTAKRLKILPLKTAAQIDKVADPRAKARLICDYLASLTDTQAIAAYKRLFEPGHISLGELAW